MKKFLLLLAGAGVILAGKYIYDHRNKFKKMPEEEKTELEPTKTTDEEPVDQKPVSPEEMIADKPKKRGRPRKNAEL